MTMDSILSCLDIWEGSKIAFLQPFLNFQLKFTTLEMTSKIKTDEKFFELLTQDSEYLLIVL